MSTSRATLLLTAAPRELASLAAAWPGTPLPTENFTPARVSGRLSLASSGVGKVNASIAVAMLARGNEPLDIINIGLCGSLPCGDGAPSIGDIVLASASIYADEGVATPGGFLHLHQVGFPIGGPAFAGSSITPDPDLLDRIEPALGTGFRRGAVATVSTCSGTDQLAAEVHARTGAIAEAMEGAAIGHAAALLGGGRLRFAEVRVVSNTTGDRERQRWDLGLAFDRMTHIARRLSECLE